MKSGLKYQFKMGVPWLIFSTAGTKYLSHTTARAKNKYRLTVMWKMTAPSNLCCRVKKSPGKSSIAGGVQFVPVIKTELEIKKNQFKIAICASYAIFRSKWWFWKVKSCIWHIQFFISFSCSQVWRFHGNSWRKACCSKQTIESL